ncbi:MAG: PEP-CTERM sorting domain-containing protein [Pirellulales bacterium]|nr:PEP-CTERM sorting domain-containing protein [Pirellulales bacterium]
MSKITTVSIVAVLFMGLCGLYANASTVSYQLAVDGVVAPLHVIAPGTHVLEISAMVTGNELMPGVQGGLFQSAINLMETGNSLTFEEKTGLFGGLGVWKSSKPAAFTSFFEGSIKEAGYEVFAQTGAVGPGEYGSLYSEVAANTWTPVFWGNFDYDGGITTLDLMGAVNEHLVAAVQGAAVGAAYPTEIIGTSTSFGIPEPSTFAILGISLIGLGAFLRKR